MMSNLNKAHKEHRIRNECCTINLREWVFEVA